MKLLCLLILLGATAHATAAEESVLSVCNHNPDRAIYAAHMRQVGAGAGWQSNGWFKVEAQKCFDLKLGKYVGNAYLYAQDEFQESTWGEGGVPFCVHATQGFSLNNADSIPCNATQQKKVTSELVSIQPGKTTWDIKPNFSQFTLCNQNAGFSVHAALARPVAGNLTSRGWYEVAGGKCRTITLGKYVGPVSYYATGNQLTWEGDATPFCVNSTQAFEIPGADLPSHCTTPGLETIHPRTTDVVVGNNQVQLEIKTLATKLILCNRTDKVLTASRALPTDDSHWAASGWDQLDPQKCIEHHLGNYAGKVQVYAEWNEGEMYWGNGPFEFCVHRTQNFDFSDSTDAAQCNSNIQLKMVPSFELTVKAGTNLFNFNP